MSKVEIDKVEQVLATSLLLGYDHGSSTINLADESVNLSRVSYNEAIKYLKKRISVSKDEWNDLEPKLRFRAFTVARLTQVDYIEAAKGRLIDAMEKGEGLAETWKDIKAIAAEDSSALLPGYWETVYRTNIQTSYNAGKRIEFNKNPPEAIALLVIEDLRTSTICKPLIGLVLPGNHPFWKSNWPPFHYNCRTTVRRVEKHEIGKTIQVENPSMAFLRKKFKPMSGFGKDPVDNGTWWMMHQSQVKRGIINGIITEFNRSENVIADYDDVWEGYVRVKDEKGGWYDLVDNPPGDWETDNKPVVERMIKDGYRIKVLPLVEGKGITGWKNPDVYINGVLADIKKSKLPSKSSIQHRLDDAQKQGLFTVILEARDEMDPIMLKRAIDGKIGNHGTISRLFVLFRDKIYDLSKNDIRTANYSFE